MIMIRKLGGSKMIRSGRHNVQIHTNIKIETLYHMSTATLSASLTCYSTNINKIKYMNKL